MKKMKMFLLTAALAVGFSACGNNNAKDDQGSAQTEGSQVAETTADGDFSGKTLKVAGLDGGYGTEGWNEVIKKFEEKTGAKVESQFEKNISEVLRPEIQAGNLPDVIYLSIGQQDSLTETMLKENMVMDITDILDRTIPGEDTTVKDKLIPGFINTVVTDPYNDGKTYLAPLFYAPAGLWYNQAMFKDGGGKYELPETMDEFIALGKEAEKDGVALFTYPVSGYMDTFIFAFAGEVGGQDLINQLVNYDVDAWKNDAKPIFDTTGEILKYLNKNTVSQANKESFTQNQLSVMKNETLFMPNGTWIVGEMANAEGVADGFKWGFMALPSYEGSDRYSYSFCEQAFIPKDAEEPELAKEFLAYLYSDEAAKIFAENGGAIQPINNYADFVTDEDAKLYYSVFDEGVKPAIASWAIAPPVEGVNIHNELFNKIDSVANGDITVDEWHDSVVKAAEKLNDAIEAEK